MYKHCQIAIILTHIYATFNPYSDALSKHETVFCELLNEAEKPPSFGPPLRTLMKLPLDRIKCYAYLLKKLTDYFAKVSSGGCWEL